MNFQDLLAKMKQIDEAVVEPKDELQGGAGASDECGDMSGSSDALLIGEKSVEECGGDMMPHEAPKQSDSVTMSVNMNGSGAGGIRDLMSILKNIEQGGASQDADDVLVGIGEEAFDNAPDPQTAGPEAVINPPSNDMHSKGAEAEKVNGGGNPMGIDEGLLSRLTSLYQEVKLR